MVCWTCIRCGAVERLTYTPDCCACGGTMETQDGRVTAGVQTIEAAAEGDRAAIVTLWHEGYHLSESQRVVIDELLVANRVAVLEASYAGNGRAAA